MQYAQLLGLEKILCSLTTLLESTIYLICVVGKPEAYPPDAIACKGKITRTDSFWCRKECVLLLCWRGIYPEHKHVK